MFDDVISDKEQPITGYICDLVSTYDPNIWRINKTEDELSSENDSDTNESNQDSDLNTGKDSIFLTNSFIEMEVEQKGQGLNMRDKDSNLVKNEDDSATTNDEEEPNKGSERKLVLDCDWISRYDEMSLFCIPLIRPEGEPEETDSDKENEGSGYQWVFDDSVYIKK